MTPTLRRLAVATALALGLAAAPTIALAAPGSLAGPTAPPPPPRGVGAYAVDRPDLTVELDDTTEANGVVEGRIALSAPLTDELAVTVQLLFPSASPWDVGCPEVPMFGAPCAWTIDLDVPAGTTEVPFVVDVVDDDGPEPTEVIAAEVTFVHPGGRVDVGPAAEASIVDGEGVELSIPDEVEAWEGDTGAQRTLDVVVTAGDPVPEPVTVRVHTAVVGESATPGVDYSPVDVQAVIPAGATSVTVEVPIAGDDVDEADELLLVFLSDPTLGEVAFDGGTAVGRILDDDGPGEGPGRPAPGPGDLATRGGDAGRAVPGGYQSPSRSAR